MEILGKTFLVYGMQKSGKSAVKFLLERGAKCVYTFDDKSCDNILGASSLDKFEDVLQKNIDYVILSPGVPVLGNKNIELLRENKIKYTSEFNVGFLFSRGKKICVTGTNGKTTTVNLIFSILKTKYSEVFLCGNTDTPITQIANKTTNNSILVCEVSSFALESITKDFSPDVSVITNIGVDHLSRHKTISNYIKAKLNITKYQKNNCFFITNKNKEIKTNAQKIYFSINNNNSNIYIENNFVIFKKINNKNKIKKEKILNINKIKLIGKKNIENIMCAVLVAKIFGIKNHKIKKAIYSFLPLEHRLEKVYRCSGVTFIDDSKATNIDSTIFALESFNSNVILLLGGSDKGYEFDKIFEYTQNVKFVITFGEMGQKIYDCAKRHNFENVAKFEHFCGAVLYSKQIAKGGDIVLLSPACASFDEFNSYKERGDKFLEIVKGCYEKK